MSEGETNLEETFGKNSTVFITEATDNESTKKEMDEY